MLASLATPKRGYAIMPDVAAWSGNKTKPGPATLDGALTKPLGQGLLRRVEESGIAGLAALARQRVTVRPGPSLLRRWRTVPHAAQRAGARGSQPAVLRAVPPGGCIVASSGIR
jgi:DNA-binding PadR family transcriptional regulator